MMIKKDKINVVLTEYSNKRYDEAMIKKYGEEYREYRSRYLQLVGRHPIHLDFEIIDNCNFRCNMCPRSTDLPFDKKKKINTGIEFPFDTYKSIIDYGVKNGLLSVSFGVGDEPLLNKKLMKFVKYAHKKNIMDIRMHTNGLLMTPDISKEFIENGITWLSISLDAVDEESFMQARNNRKYDEIVKNINDFLEIRKNLSSDLPSIRLSYILIDENHINQKDRFIEKWVGKVDHVGIQNCMDFNVSKYGNIRKFFCQDPFRRLWIRANGDVYPCCCMVHVSSMLNTGYMGNIKDKTISEIWNGDKMNDFRKSFIDVKPKDICIECWEKRTRGL